MPTLSKVEIVKPPGKVVVPPRAFADTWEERPRTEVCMGLRLVAATDLDNGITRAGRIALEMHPKAAEDPIQLQLWNDAYKDALQRWIVARGTCDPNNVGKAWSGWAAAPELIVPEALTKDGTSFIFDEWEKLSMALDPTAGEFEEDGVDELVDLLLNGRIEELAPQRSQRVKRWLLACLKELRPTE